MVVALVALAEEWPLVALRLAALRVAPPQAVTAVALRVE